MSETRAIIDALASNLGDALGAMTGLTVRTMPAAGDVSIEWQAEIEVGGSGVGTVFMGLSRDGATQLVAAILGDPSLVADADIVDSLKELLGQAAGAHVNGSGKGLTFRVTTPAPANLALPPDGQVFDLLVGAGAPIRLAGWGRVIAGLADASTGAPAARSTRPVTTVPPAPMLASPPPPTIGPAAPAPRNLDVVLDIELPITVRFGETQMTLESLAKLGPGSMIDLDRSPDDPVDLLVNGHLVARGQVVVVSGCYGVRISEVVSPADRLRSLQF
jgi:flagellar motor switch protein FliN